MRTTITIEEALLEELKQKAAAGGTSVSRLIEDSVRLVMGSEEEGGEAPFELVTYGKGGKFTPLNVDKTKALLELDDLERYGSAGE